MITVILRKKILPTGKIFKKRPKYDTNRYGMSLQCFIETVHETLVVKNPTFL